MKNLDSRWEQHFIQESQLLEDKLSRGEIIPMASRLKMALENNILEWANYCVWAQQNYLLPVLKRGLYKDQVITLQKKVSSFKAEVSRYDLQKYQMLAVDRWENKLIILGLEPIEALNALNIEYILVLTPPEIITTLMGEALQEGPIMAIPGVVPMPPTPGSDKKMESDATALFDLTDDSKDSEKESDEEAHSKKEGDHEGSDKPTPLDLPQFGDLDSSVNFNELLVAVTPASTTAPSANTSKVADKKVEEKTSVKEVPAKPAAKKTTPGKPVPEFGGSAAENNNFVNSIDTIQYWNKINQEHNSLSSDARKHFDGYAVLKISGQKTELFKLDEELQAEKLDPNIFAYDLSENFFVNLVKTRTTDSISLKMLRTTILDFNYVCATPLFLGDKPVGFILGFKISAMNQQDEDALYRLMQSA